LIVHSKAILMYFTSKQLSSGVISALESAGISFNEKTKNWLVSLPQMDRSDYDSFKKILSEIHGKWNRSKNAHVFDNDPTELIETIVQVGCMPQMKPHDAFFTPSAVVKNLLEWGDFWFFNADEWSDQVVFHKYLEPQAGQGNICDFLCENYPKIKTKIDCCEIDGFNRNVLKSKGFNVIGEDFLDLPVDPTYQWVIMNPPFNGKQGDYVDHITHAFKFLKEYGKLLAIVPDSFLNSKIERIVNFRNWVFTYGSHARLPEKSFAESGTNIDCVMLKIDKFPDKRIKELEALGSLCDYFDTYTGQIVIALQSQADWDKHYKFVATQIEKGKITSKTKLFEQFIYFADDIVHNCIYREECDFRWDAFTKPRLTQYFYEKIVEDYFQDRSPFDEPTKQSMTQLNTPLQLSLFN
jgi:hypothetical protein